MKFFNTVIISLIIIVTTALIGCNPEYYGEPNENKKLVSSFTDDESHNNGVSCMNCHIPDGDAEGIFDVAGSVFDSTKTAIYPNATIELFTKANGDGTLIESLEVDMLGNFYTTEDVDLSGGLFPVITGITGIKMYMTSATTSGDCNSCHGTTAEKIWIK